MEHGKGQLENVYEACKVILETYYDTQILQTIIGENKSEKICDIVKEIIQDIEELLNDGDI